LTNIQSFIEFLQALNGSVVVFGEQISISLGGKTIELTFLAFNSKTGAYPLDLKADSILIYEDQWCHKPEIIKSRIKALLGLTEGIHGRKTKAQRIDQATAKAFLEIHHLQGAIAGKFRYGLYAKDTLVAVACFAAGRNVPKIGPNYRSYELIRYATSCDKHVVGGLDKLLNAFVKENNPSDIMTYCDLAWGQGEGFQKLGFEVVATLDSVVNYLNVNTLQRFSMQQAKGLESSLQKILTSGSLKLLRKYH
jgi:hypothetical protein